MRHADRRSVPDSGSLLVVAGSAAEEGPAREIAAGLARSGRSVVFCFDSKRSGEHSKDGAPEGCAGVALPRPKRDRLWSARERLVAAAELVRLQDEGSTDRDRIESIAERAPRRLRDAGATGRRLLSAALAGLPPSPQVTGVLEATGGRTVILVAGSGATPARLAFASAAERAGARVVTIGGAPFAERLPDTAGVAELLAALGRPAAHDPARPGMLARTVGLAVALRLGRHSGAPAARPEVEPPVTEPAAPGPATEEPTAAASVTEPLPPVAQPAVPDGGPPGLRILFLMHAANFDRLFEASIRQLLAAGHTLHIAADGAKGDTRVFEDIAAQYPRLTFGRAPAPEETGWSLLAHGVRSAINYLRYLDARYDEAVALRERAAQRAPQSIVSLSRRRPGRLLLGSKPVLSLLKAVEASIPVDGSRAAFIERHAPDVVLVTPLVGLGSTQGDDIRCARKLGIPSALLVASWDNLTNKGRILAAPDRVVVWNPAQIEEAVSLHDIPRDAVIATGAHPYDQWFDWRPSTTREEFCARVGLDPARPIILYVGSSPFIAPDESRWVAGWLEGLRSSPVAALRDAAVLIRPHPQNAATWEGAEVVQPGLTTIWPRGGATPTSAEAKAEYFDSIHHCAAVVGINTSALIESAIIGRPVLTLLSDAFRSTQEGTLHFAHLSDPHSGVLTVAETLEEHHLQLAGAVGGSADIDRIRRFVGSFVRPHGVDVAATPLVADAIERTALLRPGRWREPLGHAVVRALLVPGLLVAAVLRRSAATLSIRRRPTVRSTRPASAKHLKVALVLDESLIGSVWLRSLLLRLHTEGHRVILAFESLTVGGRKALAQEPVSVTAGLRSRDDSYRRAARIARSRSSAALRAMLERAIPSMAAADRFIEKASPDVCVVLLPEPTPYSTELLKSAQALGVPTVALRLEGDRVGSATGHLVDVRIAPGTAGDGGGRRTARATTGDDVARIISSTVPRRTGRAHAARPWNLPLRVALGILGTISLSRPTVPPVIQTRLAAPSFARRKEPAPAKPGTTAAERKAAKPPKPLPKPRPAVPEPAPSQPARIPDYLALRPEDKAPRAPGA